MVFFRAILFFVLSHLVALPLATDDGVAQSLDCPPFDCGSLGLIRFPFNNESLPQCGLYTVKNCKQPPEEKPKIQLKPGLWFDVDSISQANVIHINDTELGRRISARDCSILRDLALPTSASSSLSTINNQTLYNCTEGPKDALPLYISSFSCPGYYTNLNSSSRFPSCSTIFIPVRPVGRGNSVVQFTADFQLQVMVSESCNECMSKGGQCKTTPDGKFSCAVVGKPQKGNKQLWKNAGLGFGIPLVLLSMLVFGFWYNRKQLAAPNFLARSVSHQLNSKSDMERGNVYFEVPIFSYSELEEATNKFHHDRELGHGGFGAVYLGKLRDGRVVAVKRLYHQSYKLAEQFMNEVKILTRLRHKNLVSLYGCTSSKSDELLLVYEFIPNGTVADHLHAKGANPSFLTWPIRMGIAIETASALAYLHASDIIHRDVKTNNILLDKNFSVKVADFGVSRLFPHDVSHISTAPQGTLGYIDPQYFQSFQLTAKSDVYAYGVLLLELISSMLVIDATRHSDEIGLINFARHRIENQEVNKLIDPKLEHHSDNEVRRMATSVVRLAFQCLQQDREKRPTMEGVLEALKMIVSGEEFEAESEEDDSVLLKKFETLSP